MPGGGILLGGNGGAPGGIMCGKPGAGGKGPTLRLLTWILADYRSEIILRPKPGGGIGCPNPIGGPTYAGGGAPRCWGPNPNPPWGGPPLSYADVIWSIIFWALSCPNAAQISASSPRKKRPVHTCIVIPNVSEMIPAWIMILAYYTKKGEFNSLINGLLLTWSRIMRKEYITVVTIMFLGGKLVSVLLVEWDEDQRTGMVNCSPPCVWQGVSKCDPCGSVHHHWQCVGLDACPSAVYNRVGFHGLYLALTPFCSYYQLWLLST